MNRVTDMVREHPIIASILGVMFYLAPSLLAHIIPIWSTVLASNPLIFTLMWDVVVAGCLINVVATMRTDTDEKLDRREITFIVVMLILVWFIGNLSGTIINIWQPDEAYAGYSERLDSASIWLTYALSLIAAPLAEETIMRGIVYGSLRGPYRPVACALASATTFALIHGTMVHIPLTFMLGLMLCYIYERTGKLMWCIIVHMCMNAATLFIIPALEVPAWLVSLPVGTIGCITLISITLLALRFSEDEPAQG